MLSFYNSKKLEFWAIYVFFTSMYNFTMNNKLSEYLNKIEQALNVYLPEKNNFNWQKLSFNELNEAVSSSLIENLITPCKNLMSLGGKRWRPLLLVLCSELARQSGFSEGLSLEESCNLTPLVEFVHTASLIHDDIEDGADTRRGKPAAHITYGLDTAINAGSWLYFEATTCIEALNCSVELKKILYSLYSQELRRLHLGQAMDIFWHRNPSVFPSLKEYSAMVQCKTGTLASLAVQAGLIAGGVSQEIAAQGGKLAAKLGEGFQIIDDVQNLTTGNPGKKRGDDTVEGKKSLPVLIHLESEPNDTQKIARLFEKAQKEGIESCAVEEAIRLLESKGAILKASELGKKCVKENSYALANLFETANKSEAAKLILELFEGMLPNA